MATQKVEKGAKYVQYQNHVSDVSIINFEYTSHFFLVFLLLTSNKQMLVWYYIYLFQYLFIFQ